MRVLLRLQLTSRGELWSILQSYCWDPHWNYRWRQSGYEDPVECGSESLFIQLLSRSVALCWHSLRTPFLLVTCMKEASFLSLWSAQCHQSSRLALLVVRSGFATITVVAAAVAADKMSSLDLLYHLFPSACQIRVDWWSSSCSPCYFE